jgi:hypothetical protein
MHNYFQPDVRIKSIEDLAEGRDAALDRLCNHVLLGTPIIELPKRERLEISGEEEALFLGEKLKELNALRATVLAESRSSVQKLEEPRVKMLVLAGDNNTSVPLNMPRQRYQNISWDFLQCTAGGIDLDLVIKRLKDSAEDYVVLCGDFHHYDEAFVSGGIDALETAASPLAAVLFGVWFVTPMQGQIVGQAFSRRNPAETPAEALALYPFDRDLLSLLALCVWRREPFISLLQSIAGKEPTAAFEEIFRYITGPCVSHTKVHGVITPMRK